MHANGDTRPDAVTIEKHRTILWASLRENIAEVQRYDEEGQPIDTAWEWDEYVYQKEWSEQLRVAILENPNRYLLIAKAYEKYGNLSQSELAVILYEMEQKLKERGDGQASNTGE